MTLRARMIQEILTSDLEEAQHRYATATAQFEQIMRDTPSGLPHPDGTLRIQKAGQERSLALEAYRRALRLFHEFILNDIVPGDLRDPKE